MAFMPWKKKEPMEQRIEFGIKALRTLNFRALCQEYGISAKTGYKWKERFLREGIRGMEEQSRRPQSHADQLPEEYPRRAAEEILPGKRNGESGIEIMQQVH